MTIKEALHAMQSNKEVIVYLSDIDRYVKAKVIEVQADTESVLLDYYKPIKHAGVFELSNVHDGDPDEILVDSEENIYTGKDELEDIKALLEEGNLEDIKFEMEKEKNDQEFIKSRALEIAEETGISFEEAETQAEREFDMFVNTQQLWDEELS